ncbi:MAG TPA: carboxypeptidase regulatory-like domain-containing protein [Terriglobales bacterium]|jgi:hypothetical protein|nr:carboxypeptidase regulatory-like domain-containing protein [Terriglobales bacterium]
MPASIRQRLQCTRFPLFLLILLPLSVPFSFAQSELATVFGRITDQSGAVMEGAEVEARSIDTNISITTATNRDGLYTIPSLHPGHYVISVRKPGFKTVSVTQLELNVQDNVARNFVLQVGSASESVTVTADASKINTTDATVSTVVDRNFAENLPTNGRSFQTLLQLTPGVVLTTSNFEDGGQFSVNGQRASSNYWMVDGVSANIGASANGLAGNGLSGSLPGVSVQGGTNSLVSVDAMQEFRIQTSSYAPEFGRNPGAQISIVTRSGSNQFHGGVFEYLRNDHLDANDWFADHDGLPKPQERTNDFGGTLAGPIIKNRTFFFFSYEGLRLRLPQVAETIVPDISARQASIPAVKPFLNAYSMPNGNDLGSGRAEFNSSFSNKSGLNAYGLRLDHKISGNLTFFGRYNYAPSDLLQRGFSGQPLSIVFREKSVIQTVTAGSTWSISPIVANEMKINYSTADASGFSSSDTFGGAIPLSSAPFPVPFDLHNSFFNFNVLDLGTQTALSVGKSLRIRQKQLNLVDNLSLQKGSHSIKVGVDFRRLAPLFDALQYSQQAIFLSTSSAENGNLLFSLVESGRPANLLFRNLGTFAQDTWRVVPRLTVTYGLRWDVDFAPGSASGPSLPSVTGFNLNDVSQLALAPAGTAPFKTPYGGFAPRAGLAYQIRQTENWQTVLRGGAGVFYDTATQEVGNNVTEGIYPFGSNSFNFGGTFPLDSVTASPPPVTPANLTSLFGGLFALDPHLKLPYTVEWNLALEQGIGMKQSVSASYIGSIGRRLIQTEHISAPNPSFGSANLVSNSAISNYNAFQIQFQRQLSRGFQALASYTWSHSIDTASAGSAFGLAANAYVPSVDPRQNRGPSDFDNRHAFSAGTTYDIPAVGTNRFTTAVVAGWSLENILQARSALPVNVFDGVFGQLSGAKTQVRPDIIPGQPVYLSGNQFPGGKALNRQAFIDPPVDNNGNPLRQGDLGRNALRAFSAFQWDLAVHREFALRESLKLQFRAELFNVVNHPNFGPPVNDLSDTGQFGRSTQMLGKSLDSSNQGGGSFSPLYQIGGPRSVQLALKLQF